MNSDSKNNKISINQNSINTQEFTCGENDAFSENSSCNESLCGGENMHSDEVKEYIREERKKAIEKANKKSHRSTLIFISVIIFYIIFSNNFYGLIKASGKSMLPTIPEGSHWIIDRVHDDYNYDDIVACDSGQKILLVFDQILIKRIVGMPGDTLQIKDGILYINGKPENRNFDLINDPGCLKDPLTLQEDEYFCMGDNRNNSVDSRTYGAFKKSKIQGKLIKKLL